MSQANRGQGVGRDSAPFHNAQYQHLTPFDGLITKLEELEDYSRRTLLNFPKFERHILTTEVRLCIENIERYAITAWRRYHKKTTLQNMDVEIDILRRKVRKANRYEYISPGQYKEWAGHVSELGAILGGWLRHERSKCLIDMFPRYAAVDVADSGFGGKRKISMYMPQLFACRVPRPDLPNLIFGKSRMSVLFSSGVIAGMAKRILDIFFYRSVLEITKPVVKRVPVQVTHYDRARLYSFPALKHEPVNRYQLGLSLLSNAAFPIRRGIGRLNSELRNLDPVICAGMSA